MKGYSTVKASGCAVGFERSQQRGAVKALRSLWLPSGDKCAGAGSR